MTPPLGASIRRIFAPALAYNLGAGFVPVRKPNKLPADTERISYELEYEQKPARLMIRGWARQSSL